MEQVTVSSKGQIAIPKEIREALNLGDGTKLKVEVSGQSIVLSKLPSWKKLHGSVAGPDLMPAFAAFRKQERDRENSGS